MKLSTASGRRTTPLDLPVSPASDVTAPATHLSRELLGLLDAGIFAPVHRSNINDTIDSKWVLDWKADKHGWRVKAKARLVARGFKQPERNHFGETNNT